MPSLSKDAFLMSFWGVGAIVHDGRRCGFYAFTGQADRFLFCFEELPEGPEKVGSSGFHGGEGELRLLG